MLEVWDLTCIPNVVLSLSNQIVKRQCWLNEILCGHTWTPESSDSSSSKEPAAPSDEDQASEADLQAVLAGMFDPLICVSS